MRREIIPIKEDLDTEARSRGATTQGVSGDSTSDSTCINHCVLTSVSTNGDGIESKSDCVEEATKCDNTLDDVTNQDDATDGDNN